MYDFNDGASSHCCQSVPVNGGVAQNYSSRFRSNDLSFWLGEGFLITPKLFVTAEPEAEYREWLRLLPTGEFDTRED